MSTQIVDNFQLNVGKPIDSRMVTSGTASRNALKFKYEGLRVYDIINKAPYVYIDSAWQQESSSGGGGGGITRSSACRKTLWNLTFCPSVSSCRSCKKCSNVINSICFRMFAMESVSDFTARVSGAGRKIASKKRSCSFRSCS